MRTPLIVIGGKSRSGKTWLTAELHRRMSSAGGTAAVLCMDDYLGGPGYLEAVGVPVGSFPIERELALKFNYTRILGDVEALLSGSAIHPPVYDRERRRRRLEQAQEPLLPGGSLILEGTPALCMKELERFPSVRIYVEAAQAERRDLLMKDWMETKGLGREEAERLFCYRTEHEEPYIERGRATAGWWVTRLDLGYRVHEVI